MRDEGKQSGSLVCCEACGTAVPAYDVVNYGSIEQGYRELCSRCFNAEVASAMGLDRFENVHLHPVVMTDCAGERHEFHFRMRLLGSIAALDAFELTAGAPGGYQFQTLVHPSGIEGLIFGSWAALSGERLSCVGPAEGPGHGGVEIGDELLDPGLQHLLAGEVAAADKLSHQNGKPDFDLIEP